MERKLPPRLETKIECNLSEMQSFWYRRLLLKDSSLVMVIGLHELTGGLSLSLSGDPVWRAFYFEAYLFVGLVYALMCLALARLGRHLEARWPQAL